MAYSFNHPFILSLITAIATITPIIGKNIRLTPLCLHDALRVYVDQIDMLTSDRNHKCVSDVSSSPKHPPPSPPPPLSSSNPIYLQSQLSSLSQPYFNVKVFNKIMVFGYWTFNNIQYSDAIICSNRWIFPWSRLHSSTPVACQGVADHAFLNRFKQWVANRSFDNIWLHGNDVLDVSLFQQ